MWEFNVTLLWMFSPQIWHWKLFCIFSFFYPISIDLNRCCINLLRFSSIFIRCGFFFIVLPSMNTFENNGLFYFYWRKKLKTMILDIWKWFEEKEKKVKSTKKHCLITYLTITDSAQQTRSRNPWLESRWWKKMDSNSNYNNIKK